MKRFFINVLLICLASLANAQKLPSTQTIGILAPKDIKIDGKPLEWQQFQAYNNAIECFYTLSNDTTNLYLVVQATDQIIIQKIASGGITLTLQPTEKAGKYMPVSITYPLIPSPYNEGISSVLRHNKTISDKQLSDLNTKVYSHVKEIPLTGIKGIADSVVSIYNDFGIKAAGLIDQQKVYTCELALPLKYIEQLFDTGGQIKYRIQLNGLDTTGKYGVTVVGGHSMNPSDDPVNHDALYFLVAPTYLQGTYTRAK